MITGSHTEDFRVPDEQFGPLACSVSRTEGVYLSWRHFDTADFIDLENAKALRDWLDNAIHRIEVQP